jgi:hypothetical protein
MEAESYQTSSYASDMVPPQQHGTRRRSQRRANAGDRGRRLSGERNKPRESAKVTVAMDHCAGRRTPGATNSP